MPYSCLRVLQIPDFPFLVFSFPNPIVVPFHDFLFVVFAAERQRGSTLFLTFLLFRVQSFWPIYV
jgi:hypothetical protein